MDHSPEQEATAACLLRSIDAGFDPRPTVAVLNQGIEQQSSNMASKRKVLGRPMTFDLKMRRKMARLILRHGIRGAERFSPVPISVGTLIKIAREHGVELKKGKRPQQPDGTTQGIPKRSRQRAVKQAASERGKDAAKRHELGPRKSGE